MAKDKIKDRIPGPLETCPEVAERYYRDTLKHLDYAKGRKVPTKVSDPYFPLASPQTRS